MGAPGWTSFCIQGHIVECCPHHGIIDEPQTVCGICGSKEVKEAFEWPDEDYEQCVPTEPIRSEEIFREVKCSHCEGVNKIPMGQVDIYDVSKLFSETDSCEKGCCCKDK